jgi:hypothetical protein
MSVKEEGRRKREEGRRKREKRIRKSFCDYFQFSVP